MLTIPEATEKVIKRSRYLNEAISKRIINISSLARYIEPELEEIMGKKVSHAAVVMSLKRLSTKIKPQHMDSHLMFKSSPEMIVRSNLHEIVIANSPTLAETCSAILEVTKNNPKHLCTISKGTFYTTVIVSEDMRKLIEARLKKEQMIDEFPNLSAISIQLTPESYDIPGVFYFFLKSLAWEGVNIVDVISTYLEFTIIIHNKDTNRTFSILQSLFNKKN